MKSRSSNDRITSVGNGRTEKVPPHADIAAESDGDQLQAGEGRILRIGDEAGLKPDLNEWDGRERAHRSSQESETENGGMKDAHKRLRWQS